MSFDEVIDFVAKELKHKDRFLPPRDSAHFDEDLYWRSLARTAIGAYNHLRVSLIFGNLDE